MLKMALSRELEFVGYHAEAWEYVGTILGKRKHASISDFVMLSFPLKDIFPQDSVHLHHLSVIRHIIT